MKISVRELHLKDQETHHWDWKEAGTNWISLEWKLISILSLWMRMSKDMSGKNLEDIYEDELSELEGEELQQSLRLVMEDQMGRVEQRKKDQGLTPYETVLQGASAADWKKAEYKRGLGYSGPPAARTEREHRQKARKAEEINQKIRQG